MSSLHPESALAGSMGDNTRFQPLLRDTSSSSIYSQSLSSTPTTLSSFSYTQSSSGLDTPSESIRDEEFTFCVDDPTGISRLDQPFEERFHRVMTLPRFRHHLGPALADLDGGYESEVEVEVEGSRTFAKPRKKSSTPSFASAAKRKTGLSPRRPASSEFTFSSEATSQLQHICVEPHYSKTNRSSSPSPLVSTRPPNRPTSIGLAGLHYPFHGDSCLGVSMMSPSEGYRVVSSPTECRSLSPPPSPPAAPSFRGTALPFSPPALDDMTCLFPVDHSGCPLPSLHPHNPCTPPCVKLLPPIPLPPMSPPLYPQSEPRHQLRSVTSPSPLHPPLSSRDSSPASRTPIPPASLSSRLVMLNHRLSLVREPRRPKTPPIPPKLVGSSRLDAMMDTTSYTPVNGSADPEAHEAPVTNTEASPFTEDGDRLAPPIMHSLRSLSLGHPLSTLGILPFPESGETHAYLQLAATNNCSSDECGLVRPRPRVAYRYSALVLDHERIDGI